MDDVFNFTDENLEIKDYGSVKTKNCPKSRPPHTPCCDNLCNTKEYDNQLKIKVEKVVKIKSSTEIKQTLLNHLHSQDNMEISTHGFHFGGRYFCPKYFSLFSKVSPYLINEVFKAFAAGQKHFIHGNIVGLRETSASIACVCWVKQFAEYYGNFSPDEELIVISGCFTIKEIFDQYLAQSKAPHVSRSSFYQILTTKFGPRRDDKSLPRIRLSAYSSHSRCDQCLMLEKFQRSCQTEADRTLSKSLKQEHKQTFVRARVSVDETRTKLRSCEAIDL